MPQLPPVEIIRHTAGLRALVDRVRAEPLLAVDTESNSLYAYYERVCLVQLSTRTQDYIIDPLSIDDRARWASAGRPGDRGDLPRRRV